MEPKKLITSIGIFLTTIIAIILFIIEYKKVVGFFFPEKREISIPFYVISLISILFLLFFFGYKLYYREKEKHRKTNLELENTRQLLTDSERLRLMDFVTGIPNEQKFKLDIENRTKELYHLILIDLDGFGEINKKKGFQNGDKVIRTIAQEVFIKMRRDEEIYKRNYKINRSFTKRIYRKYTGGDEFIFLIKGDQYEAVGFITRIQKQLRELTNELPSEIGYEIEFHGAIVPLYPNDTYSQAIDKLERAYVQAAEEKDNLRVFWDCNEEGEFKEKYGFIYDNARREFKIRNDA